MLYQEAIGSWDADEHLNVVERDAAYWTANLAAAQALAAAGWEFFLGTTIVGEDGTRTYDSLVAVPASSLGPTQPGMANIQMAWDRLPVTCRADFLSGGQRTLKLDVNYVPNGPPRAKGQVGQGGTSDSCTVSLPAVGLESERFAGRSAMHELGHCLYGSGTYVELSPCLEPYRSTVEDLFWPPYAGGPDCSPLVGTVTGYEAGALNENLSNYVFDPERFRARITEDLLCGSDVLLQKYQFWRDNFYGGVEFCGIGSGIYECTVDPSSYIP
jgi:hypothetical protein